MILVTGAGGQLGSDLVEALVARHGADNVLATDLRIEPGSPIARSGARTASLDVTDAEALTTAVREHAPEAVYHLAGILSARGEQRPDLCWEVNIQGVRLVLELARVAGFRVFWPSSIAVFGPDTPRYDTPQATVTHPSTMYGITKVAGEMLAEYYARRWNVDVRSVRYPGIISWSAPPGGGTTDFAPEMFFEARRSSKYTCFVGPQTRLPMMYMPDAVKAALDLMDADAARLTVRTSYNLTAFSFSAEELAREVTARVPGFEVAYAPDYRQAIADSWPAVIDDSQARTDWDWSPAFDVGAMADDMLAHLA